MDEFVSEKNLKGQHDFGLKDCDMWCEAAMLFLGYKNNGKTMRLLHACNI